MQIASSPNCQQITDHSQAYPSSSITPPPPAQYENPHAPINSSLPFNTHPQIERQEKKKTTKPTSPAASQLKYSRPRARRGPKEKAARRARTLVYVTSRLGSHAKIQEPQILISLEPCARARVYISPIRSGSRAPRRGVNFT